MKIMYYESIQIVKIRTYSGMPRLLDIVANMMKYLFCGQVPLFIIEFDVI